MKKEKIDTLTGGLIIGLLGLGLAALGIYIYFNEWFVKYGFSGAIGYMKMFQFLSRVITLLIVPNAFLFFIFIQRNYTNTARGIMIVVLLSFLLFFI